MWYRRDRPAQGRHGHSRFSKGHVGHQHLVAIETMQIFANTHELEPFQTIRGVPYHPLWRAMPILEPFYSSYEKRKCPILIRRVLVGRAPCPQTQFTYLCLRYEPQSEIRPPIDRVPPLLMLRQALMRPQPLFSCSTICGCSGPSLRPTSRSASPGPG